MTLFRFVPVGMWALVVAMRMLAGTASAQLFSYESFADMTAGPGVAGSGTGSFGWTDSGWNGGTDAHFQTVAPAPALSYQISGGVALAGGNRALQLTTSPLPVAVGLAAYRQFSPLTTSFYFSVLVRPLSVGSGTDTLDIQVGSSSRTLGHILIQPNSSGTSYAIQLSTTGGGASGGIAALVPGQTYLLVGQVVRQTQTLGILSYWLNPTATAQNSPTLQSTMSFTSSEAVSKIGFGVSSTNNAGPTSTMNVGELRMGFTWADVVPPAQVQLVPTVNIGAAVQLSWQTQSGKSYQPQYSYDLKTWTNLGSAISGNGQVKTLFDSSDATAKKYYQIQVQ